MENNLRIANEILENIGGRSNIETLAHCMTRVRIGVKNEEEVNIDEIKKIQGVKGVVKAIGIFQIIVGTNSTAVFEVIQQSPETLTEDEGHKTQKGKNIKDSLGQVVATIAACISPVIPALIASGLIAAFLSVAVQFFGLSKESNTYYIFNTVGKIGTYFLPVFCAYTASKRFDCSPILSIFMGCLMIHPNYLALVAAGEQATLLGIPMLLATYTSSLFPIIIPVWILSHIERFWKKVLPDSLQYVPVPVLTVAVMVPIMFLVAAPIGSFIGTTLANCVAIIYGKAPALGVLLVGILAPILVLTGSHLALIPIAVSNIAAYGFDNLPYVAFIGMNFSQVGVALACLLKARTNQIKQTASGALISALTGITEPSLYGLCLELKRPLIATFCATIANAIYCAIFNVHVFTLAGPSFLTLPIYIDPNGGKNFLYAIGAILLTIVVAFVVTWILGFDENAPKQKISV